MSFSVSNSLDKYAEKVKQLSKAEQDNAQKGNEQLKKITDSNQKTNTNKTDAVDRQEKSDVQKTADQQVAQARSNQVQDTKKQPEQSNVDKQRSDFLNTKQEAGNFAKNILKDAPRMAQTGELAKTPELINQKGNQLTNNLMKQEVPQPLPKDAKSEILENTKNTKTNENTREPLKQHAILDKNNKDEQIKDKAEIASKILVKNENQPAVVVKPSSDGQMLGDKKEEKSEFKSEKKKSSENATLASRSASRALRESNAGFGFNTNTNLNGGDDEGFYLDANTITIESIDEVPAGTLSGLVGTTFDEGEIAGSAGFLDKARFFHAQVLKEKSIRTTIASVSEMEDQFGMPVEKRIPSEHLNQIRLGKTTGVYRGWLNV